MSEEKNEIMTFQEIHDRFLDEWVIVLEVKSDENNQPVSGRVVFHSPEREEAYKALHSYKGQSLAFFCTGSIPEDMGVLF